MIETKDITKMVKHILRRDKGLSDLQIMHPMRDWTIGLFMTVVIVFSGSLFSVYLYQFFSEKLQQEILTPEAHVPYEAATVNTALKFYTDKMDSYNAILGQKSNQVPTVVITDAATSSLQTDTATTTSTTTDDSVPVAPTEPVSLPVNATPAL